MTKPRSGIAGGCPKPRFQRYVFSAPMNEPAPRKPRPPLKNFASTLAEALPDAARDKPLEIWFQDEARIGQQGTLTRVWVARGTRPRAPRDRRYTWCYLFGAACPGRGVGAALVMPYADTDAQNKHLAEISTTVAPNAHAVVIWDGAGYHSSRRLKVPDNITPIRLPPYSPELNSAENIWQWMRQNKLSNRTFETYDAIVDATSKAWNDFLSDPSTVTSITSRDWAQVNA